MASNNEFWIEAFKPGKWNGKTWTLDNIKNWIANFKTLRGVIEPPVKIGHNNKQPLTDGQPAIGEITDTKLSGKTLMLKLSRVPDIVVQAIKAGRFIKPSIEVARDFDVDGKKFNEVLTGVALLGADLPAVSGLKDLEAFLSLEPEHLDTVALEGTEIFSMQCGITEADNNNKENQRMADTDTQIVEFKDKLTAAEKEIDSKDRALKDAEEKIAKFESDREAERLKAETDSINAKVEDIKTFCEAEVKAGRMTPAGRDAIVLSFDKSKVVFSKDDSGKVEDVAISCEAFKAYCGTQEKAFKFAEIGTSEGGDKKEYTSAGNEVHARTEKFMAEHKQEDYVVAMNEVLKADTDLAAQYKEEVG
jgi:hypothetical protein